jgi:uncharacterized protein YutD
MMKKIRTDHRIIWTKLKDFKLNEGLIKSWTNEQFIRSFSRILEKFDVKFDYDIDEEYLSVLIHIHNMDSIKDDNRTKLYQEIENILKLSGFYSVRTLKEKDFINIKSNKPTLEFIKKFTPLTDVPRYLYHVSHPQFKEKILKNGLVPKSKRLIEDHPDRIYFTDNIKDSKSFAKLKYEFTELDEYIEYIIFKVDTSDLDLKMYIDGLKTPGSNMIFTYDNIPPSALEIVYNGKM